MAVGPADGVLAEWEAPEVVDCEGAAILPGLVNAHTHVPMSLLRGLADDLRLDVWLFWLHAARRAGVRGPGLLPVGDAAFLCGDDPLWCDLLCRHVLL